MSNENSEERDNQEDKNAHDGDKNDTPAGVDSTYIHNGIKLKESFNKFALVDLSLIGCVKFDKRKYERNK